MAGDRGIYGYHNTRRKQKTAEMTVEQKAAAKRAEELKRLVPVPGAPCKGDPEAVDWTCHCGYVPRQENGKPMPKTREPAWQWTEERGRGRKPCMRSHVADLALKVYRLGYRHSTIELHDGGGFPDDLYWGPNGLLVRELKAMRHDWKRGQKQHLLSMREAGLNVGVYYPCCILSGRVDDELAALAGVTPCGPYARGHAQPSMSVVKSALTWSDVAGGAL